MKRLTDRRAPPARTRAIPRAALLLIAAAALAPGARVARAQAGCARAAADSMVAVGWQHLQRARDAADTAASGGLAADSAFAAALRLCAGDAAAQVGRGYAALRMNRDSVARAWFERALEQIPGNYDALTGLGLSAWRLGELQASRRAFAGVLEVAPDDSLARYYVARIPAPVDASALPGRTRPDSLVLTARTAARHFQVRRDNGAWEPLWIKAVNIGAALPGMHPSEFPPDDGTYDEWLALVARMGGNAVRVYTVHPPHFYRALARWNATHADSTLWLIHGVWTELPPGAQEENYDDAQWNARFRAEMRDVVDLVHGNAAIQPRPGHASGLYDTDVSRWTLGYIIGREWEPYSVVAFAARYPQSTAHDGTYLAVRGGNAVDVWLAQFCDAMIAYEMDRYNAQRPIAYTNWPTLDPLAHPTETTKAEEARLLAARHETPPEAPREYDNDAIGLDATRWRALDRFPAGVFASYHAYPYYPDFLVLDPGYGTAESPWGRSNYFGYLRELVDHHGDMPVVISEYGVPSSRGNAHLQPQGFHHGGHDDRDQARINARLTREIHAAGAAGAGLFAIIDEWFKKNWLVIDFEQPAVRNRLWLNPLDAEQNYGVIALRAGVRDSALVIDGDSADWHGRPPLLAASAPPPGAALPAPQRLRALHVAHDEAYVYLRLTVDSLDWTRAHYLIGIDTYDRRLGDTRLPYTRTQSPVGLEFVVDLRGPDSSRVLVDEPYNLFRFEPIRGARPATYQAVLNAPFHTRANADATYDTLWVVPNRRRFGRDGTVYPAQRYDRNALRHARQDETTLADWFTDTRTGTIELRLPWGMLHVMDPSSHTVLFGDDGAGYPAGAPTDGFRFVVESYDPARPAGGGDRLPRTDRGVFASPPIWTWPAWEHPRWYAELKPQFASMRDAFSSIRGPRLEQPPQAGRE